MRCSRSSSSSSARRVYADWTVERIRHEAAAIGPATAALCEQILERRPHPEQGFRSCLGIVRLVRPFGAERLEAAAARAIEIGTLTYGSVRSILDNKLDRQPAQRRPANGSYACCCRTGRGTAAGSLIRRNQKEPNPMSNIKVGQENSPAGPHRRAPAV